ncbi:MAG: hypothetical protein HY460_01200, partial [Parcubacteria group bacterium]|nr:hypothetical protein [Parcubacteria group bacterium]
MATPGEKDNYPTKKTAGDAAHAIVRAGISAVPIIGGPAVELFQNIVIPPLEKRRDEWMKDIGERLLRLEKERGVSLEDLKESPEFIDAV